MILLALSLFSIGFGIEDQSLIVLDSGKNGIVYINADGDRGADARPSILPGASPESGTSGSSGGSVTVLIRKMPAQLIISARGGDGGNGADGARGRRGRNGDDGRNAGLFREPKSGGDGEDGGLGGDGSHGGHGGHGGHVRIIYAPQAERPEPNWRSRISVDVSGGQAGMGGQGGDGGLGGRGGQGGKKFWSSKRLSSGRDGQDGRPGREGLPGLPGQFGDAEYFEVQELPLWIMNDLYESLRESS